MKRTKRDRKPGGHRGYDPALDVVLATLGRLDLPDGRSFEAAIRSYDGGAARLRVVERGGRGWQRSITTIPLDPAVAAFLTEQLAAAVRFAAAPDDKPKETA